jgi:mannose/fructose/sorbose-specific phosphotransferase system IIA component
MVKLVIVCHGALADGLMNAMELIVGPQPEVVALRLDEADSIDGLESQVETAVQERQAGQEVLILVDLFYASPFNVSSRVAMRHAGVEVITGVNLPMLLETALGRDNVPLVELVKVARDAGTGSIKVLSDLLQAGDQAPA